MDAGIPAVQSLVQNGATEVPQRFVRPISDRPSATKISSERDDLPIIDASQLDDDDELDKLYKACTGWGFFQLIGHGIPASLLQSTREAISEFFKLPQAEKESYTASGRIGKEGYGRYFVSSEETVLDWGDTFFHSLPPSGIQWPENPPNYKATIQEYEVEIRSLAARLLAALSKALKQPPEFLSDGFGAEPQASLRMNYYPPCPEPDLVLGLSPHSDAVGITILLQDEVEGLQVKKNGEWKSVKSIPEAFVVNIGDIVEIMSNGTYKSVEHRAVVSSGKERISAAFFYSSSLDVMLKPLTTDAEPIFKEMPLSDFLEMYLRNELRGKDHLSLGRPRKSLLAKPKFRPVMCFLAN